MPEKVTMIKSVSLVHVDLFFIYFILFKPYIPGIFKLTQNSWYI